MGPQQGTELQAVREQLDKTMKAGILLGLWMFRVQGLG